MLIFIFSSTNLYFKTKNRTKYISEETFIKFMKYVYLKKRRKMKNISYLFNLLDKNENKNIFLNEFFDIVDHLEKKS